MAAEPTEVGRRSTSPPRNGLGSLVAMPNATAVHAGFWRTMVGAVAVGALTAVVSLVFLAVEHVLTGWLWGHDGAPTAMFSGSWWNVATVLVAGLVVGLLRRRLRLPGPDPNFVTEMVEGEVGARRGAGYGLLGLVSIVGGASIGPEAPLGSLGGWLGSAVGRRIGAGREPVEDLTYAGIAGVFGGLGTLPLAGPVMALEVYHERWQDRPYRMLPGIVSGTVAIAILFPFIGSPFLAVYNLGAHDLHVSWLGYAVLLGLLGAGLGVLATWATARVGQRIANPLVRATAAGAVLAAVGYAVPLTMFSGRSELGTILGHGSAAVGMGLLLTVLVLKLATFSVSMTWGFFGGPIFPLIFVGAVAGVVVHTAIPALPLVVAVPALAGAVAVALLPMPMMVIILTSMMFGLSLQLSVLPSVSVITSLVLLRGTGVLTHGSAAD